MSYRSISIGGPFGLGSSLHGFQDLGLVPAFLSVGFTAFQSLVFKNAFGFQGIQKARLYKVFARSKAWVVLDSKAYVLQDSGMPLCILFAQILLQGLDFGLLESKVSFRLFARPPRGFLESKMQVFFTKDRLIGIQKAICEIQIL